MDDITTIKEFVSKKQNGFYGFDGLHDGNVYVPPTTIHKLWEKDFYYVEKKKTIYLNIGAYHDKKPDYLLESLFIPLHELSFDLIENMKKENVKLILNNEISNLDDSFYDMVYAFFKKIDFEPIYKGVWRCQE